MPHPVRDTSSGDPVGSPGNRPLCDGCHNRIGDVTRPTIDPSAARLPAGKDILFAEATVHGILMLTLVLVGGLATLEAALLIRDRRTGVLDAYPVEWSQMQYVYLKVLRVAAAIGLQVPNCPTEMVIITARK